MRATRLLFASLLALSACFGGSETTSSSSTPPSADVPSVKINKPGQAKFLQGDVVSGERTKVYTLIWGADMAMHWANGGAMTREGSIFHDLGLNIELVPGDKISEQIASYKAGESVYIRGTFDMVALQAAKEELCFDGSTICPIEFLQMSVSNGDHIVGFKGIESLKDLKPGMRIGLMVDGPHMGFIHRALASVGMTIDQFEIVWYDSLFSDPTTGTIGPDGGLRKGEIDVACVVTSPGMLQLTGEDLVGSGMEGTLEGARVIESTKWREWDVKDVLMAHPIHYRDNTEEVVALSAGYLKAVDDLNILEDRQDPEFYALMEYMVPVFGMPNAAEAAGLFSDAKWPGYKGNVEYIDPENTHGFYDDRKIAADVIRAFGYGDGSEAQHIQHVPPAFWQHPKFKEVLSVSLEMERTQRFDLEAAEAAVLEFETTGFGGALLTRSAQFAANTTKVDHKQYAEYYDELWHEMDDHPGALLVIRGHLDNGKFLQVWHGIAKEKGLIVPLDPNDLQPRAFSFEGRVVDFMDPAATEVARQIVESGRVAGKWTDPEGMTFDIEEMVSASKLESLERAQDMRRGYIEYNRAQGRDVDESMIQVYGSGFSEPLVACPMGKRESSLNRRAEAMIMPPTKNLLEASSASDYIW